MDRWRSLLVLFMWSRQVSVNNSGRQRGMKWAISEMKVLLLVPLNFGRYLIQSDGGNWTREHHLRRWITAVLSLSLFLCFIVSPSFVCYWSPSIFSLLLNLARNKGIESGDSWYTWITILTKMYWWISRRAEERESCDFASGKKK